MGARWWSLGGAFLIAGFLGVVGAAAQPSLRSTLFNQDIPDDSDRGRNVSVTQRDHPEYDALGVPLGGFTAYPDLFLGAGYLSNVFGTKSDKVGDAYFDIDPQATVVSDWGRNAVGATVGANIRQFASRSTEDEYGWHVQLNGRYDISHDDTVTAGFSGAKLYEERDSGFYPVGAAAPLGYVDTDSFVRGTHKTGVISLTVSADYHTFDFDNVAAIGGGVLDEGFNSHNDYRLTGHGEYALTPDTALFAEVSHQRNTYTDIAAGGGQDLNGDENRFLVGGNFDLTHLIRGSVGLGYIERSYDDQAFQGISGVAVDAHLEYFPTTLLTLSGSVRRTIEDSIDFDNAGFIATVSEVRADYELLRNLLLNAEVDYENDAYKTVDRSDDITTIGVGATYNLSRNLGLGAYAAHTNRASVGTILGPTFTETRFVLSLNLKI